MRPNGGVVLLPPFVDHRGEDRRPRDVVVVGPIPIPPPPVQPLATADDDLEAEFDRPRPGMLFEHFEGEQIHRTVDLWIRKCVKYRAFLLRHDAYFPSPSGAASRTSLSKNTSTLVHLRSLSKLVHVPLVHIGTNEV